MNQSDRKRKNQHAHEAPSQGEQSSALMRTNSVPMHTSSVPMRTSSMPKRTKNWRKQNTKIALLASLLLVSVSNAHDCCQVAPYLQIRSPGQNAARMLSSLYPDVRFYDPAQPYYGSFYITPSYTRTLRPTTIADSLFGNTLFKEVDCATTSPAKRVIRVAGSAEKNMDDPRKNWIADYSYLANNFKSSLFFYPLIQTISFDVGTYVGFDHGFFMRFQAPLATTRWDIGADEVITPTTGGNGFHKIWHNNNNLVQSFLDYSCCGITPTRDSALGDPTGTSYPLGVSKICPWPEKKTGIADVHVDAGWNFVNNERHQLGIYARAVAPTGNRPEGLMLFEPLLGNGGHWEAGGGLTGHLRFWESDYENKQINFCFDAQITHLFNARQRRAFDLKKQGPLSRYMLAIDAPLGSPHINTTPIANLTYANIQTNASVQADIVALFNYASDTFTWNIGYNFWRVSCETISCYTPCTPCEKTRGLQNGSWQMIGTNSTIHKLGTNATATLLTPQDVDIDGARVSGQSHKFFTQFAYTWLDLMSTRVIPHLGIGAEYEVGGSRCAIGCAQQCGKPCCTNCMPWQWSIWLTGGFTF
ncbi:hypothetical protein CVU75_02535 [Candidatus Dependentiae bacterium HGW-Dependentiae-1]|nr:MAG: hypothetical protein CVU75_02535 [Candidatus Dependentiae bacterium HGW-Dependentiae-1]